MNAVVPLVVLLPLLGAAISLALLAHPRVQRLFALIALSGTLAAGIVLLVVVDSGSPLVMEVGGWPVPFGIALVVDRLSALLLTVSAAVLLAVLVYSIGQGLADEDDREAPTSIYYPAYLLLAAGVMNAFVAGDLFNLYVSFELLLVASYVLITVGGSETRIRAGTTYIITSLLSSLLFLAAIGFVYGATGTVNIAQIAERVADLPPGTQTLLHTALLVAFGIKAAVFPLSFWLPDSYPTAPAPVTAVFAGLLTKVGVYAIIRVETIMFPTPELNGVLLAVAALTMLIGVLGAVAQADLKRMLSFTLVSHIGYMVMGVGLGTAAGVAAAVFYTVHHIVVQTTLFLVSGLIERVGGSTAVLRLGGLLKLSPLLGVLYFVPALSLGGIPPFSGFVGKLGLFVAAAQLGTPLAYALIAAGTLTSLLTLYALIRVWSAVFWRPADGGAAQELAAEAVPAPGGAREAEADAEPASAGSGGSASSPGAAAASPGSQPAGGVAVAERPEASPVRLPIVVTAATSAMVALTVIITVAAGPLYGLASRAGGDLQGTTRYIEAVLGPDAGADPGGTGER